MNENNDNNNNLPNPPNPPNNFPVKWGKNEPY